MIVLASSAIALTGCVKFIPPAVPIAPAPPPPPAPVALSAAPPDLMEDVLVEPDRPTIRKATQKARIRPTKRCFQEGLCRLVWKPFSIYVITTAVDTDTALVLAPGERLIYFGAADTSTWKAEKTYAGDGESRQTVIIVRPTVVGSRTTATLTTALGLYRLELVSTKETYLSSVAWKHTPKQKAKLEAGIPSDTRYQMRLMSKAWPTWTPTRMWDTTRKTYLEVPEAMKSTESPVIFAKLSSGLQRVNHRLLPGGTTFELDKVATVWQLQYGPEATGEVIQIEQVTP